MLGQAGTRKSLGTCAGRGRACAAAGRPTPCRGRRDPPPRHPATAEARRLIARLGSDDEATRHSAARKLGGMGAAALPALRAAAAEHAGADVRLRAAVVARAILDAL